MYPFLDIVTLAGAFALAFSFGQSFLKTVPKPVRVAGVLANVVGGALVILGALALPALLVIFEWLGWSGLIAVAFLVGLVWLAKHFVSAGNASKAPSAWLVWYALAIACIVGAVVVLGWTLMEATAFDVPSAPP